MIESKIMRISDAEGLPMRFDRGVTHSLIGISEGATNVDLHINEINQDSGIGPYHFHEKAENVYLVLEGVVEAIINGQRYYLVENDVAFIPPGIPHAAGSAGVGMARVIEIYAPSGHDFHIIDLPDDVIEIDRPEIRGILEEAGVF